MSKFIKVSAGLALATLLGGAAQAGNTSHYTCAPPPPSCTDCDTPRTGTSTLPPLSSYFDHQAKCVVKKKVVVHVPTPVIKPSSDDCRIIVHRPKRHCYVVVKPPKVSPPVVHPPVVHPPVVRPPVIRPPVIHPPVRHTTYYQVVRPVVPVPYPVPTPYPVYTGCVQNPCLPSVRRYSRYGN